MIKVKNKNGEWVDVPFAEGKPGRDAVVDETLSIPGAAADAAAVGYVLNLAYQSLAPAGASIGQVFRVAEIFADGTYRMEPADVAEKEWQLKATMTSTDKIYVDLTGCTELFITGIVNATGNSHLGMDNGNLIPNCAANGTREWFSHWKDLLNGMECISSRSNTSGSGAFSSEGGGYSLLSRKISSIKEIFFRTPEVITSCNIKIYAR